MDSKNRRINTWQVTQAAPGIDVQRSLKKIAGAEAAFQVTVGPVSQSFHEQLSALRSDVLLGGSWASALLGRPRLPRLIPAASPPEMNAPSPPPAGPPYLLAIPLYDWCDEELHEIIDGLAIQLDEATGIDVLLAVVANPAELLPVYKLLQTLELAQQDVEAAKAYLRKLRQGQSADHIRRIEVDALARQLGVPPERLPCIAFMPFPLRVPAETFFVKREWISTREECRWFGTMLKLFLRTHLDVPSLLPRVKTGVELARLVVHGMSAWFADMAAGEARRRADSPPPANLLDEEGWYPAARLAEHFGVDKDALRKRLDRYRDRTVQGWMKNDQRGSREEQFLYRLRDVRPIIEELQASSERPAR